MIRKFISLYKTNDLVRDNVLLFAGTMIVNFFSFLFHFYMGRVLGPEDYGVLGVLLSFSYFLNVFLHSLQSSIAKFVAGFRVTSSFGKIQFLFRQAVVRLSLYGLLGVVIFYLFIPFVSSFLHIAEKSLFYIIGLLILFTLLLPLVRGIMQGLQQFTVLGFNLTIEGLVKFFGGVLFVSFGWAVQGAVLAFVLSMFVPFLFGFSGRGSFEIICYCSFFTL